MDLMLLSNLMPVSCCLPLFCSAARLAHLLREQAVGGSNPPTPTILKSLQECILQGLSFCILNPYDYKYSRNVHVDRLGNEILYCLVIVFL